jgi:ureidoacrylate peracid hydrolase
VMYTTIENLTKDGRDRSLDYKISGLGVPRGAWDGKVIDAIAPGEDEIWLPKTSSSVFMSTNVDYILRNLETKYLVVSGVLTDQCIESAVRDACDLGYLVTLVTDACATMSQERHDNTLRAIKGYCRQRTTAEFLAEIAGKHAAAAQ